MQCAYAFTGVGYTIYSKNHFFNYYNYTAAVNYSSYYILFNRIIDVKMTTLQFFNFKFAAGFHLPSSYCGHRYDGL